MEWKFAFSNGSPQLVILAHPAARDPLIPAAGGGHCVLPLSPLALGKLQFQMHVGGDVASGIPRAI